MTTDLVNKLMEDVTLKENKNPSLIETHISWVIITHKYAYKIKKPVRFSFLDFSTLDKRKYYCEKELMLNQRLSKDIYLNVLPIQVNQGHISIGAGNGKTEDYAVQMKRLQANKLMQILLEKNQVVERDIKKIALKIAGFHQEATSIKTDFDQAIVINKFNDIKQVKPFMQERFGEAEFIDKVILYAEKFVHKHNHLFHKRCVEGMIRDCHGDLHSGNIFLYANPIIFDCIEFSDSYRQIDVLNEIAFFCMDLEAHKKNELSRLFLEIYLHVFPCIRSEEEQRLFIYYKLYRANVRAKVNALKALQKKEKSEFLLLEKEVGRYIKLMKEYLILLKG